MISTAHIKDQCFNGGSSPCAAHAMDPLSTNGSATIASELDSIMAALAVGWAAVLLAAHLALCSSHSADDAMQFIFRCPMALQL